ncbi:Telomerase-binding protein EST1A [Armadillidium vulgare]|nr:Telomerase-binding protein EST1A [Armadillidium vulgare]
MDTWGVIGELATIVKGIGPPDIKLKEDSPSLPPPYFMLITLPEDAFLKGYVHIVSAQVGSDYAPCGCISEVGHERAQDWIRLKKLQVCLSQFLCGVEPPVLRLQKTDQGEILVAVVSVSPPDSPAVARCSGGSSEIDLEASSSDIEGSNSDEEGDLSNSIPEAIGEDTPLASTCRLLAKRKKLLEKKQRQQRKHEALMEGAVTLEMEVKPRYLVPDTNCFIEKLCIIKALIDSARYTFMVPLIVLVELDGLSKDAAVEKYGDVTHAVNVRRGSRNLPFISFSLIKILTLKCVTSQGSVAPANMFSLEMDTLKNLKFLK